MGKYKYKDLELIITSLKDSIVSTPNASLALCWIVELLVALGALKSGKRGEFVFTTWDACQAMNLSYSANKVMAALIFYRNTYVHTGRFIVNHRLLDLQAIQNLVNRYCGIYVDFNSKTFDTI